MRLFVTGGTGVLGRAFLPLARAAGHDPRAPTHGELDLFDAATVIDVVREVDAVLHLATRIRSLDQLADLDAWRDNDRLRADVSSILVDAALAGDACAYIQPTVAFVYPAGGPTTEDTPLGEVLPTVRSALAAEDQTARFAAAGRRSVVLRLGLLDGPGTGNDEPVRDFGASLHVEDAALALLAALTVPSGIYNVCRDHESVTNRRFSTAAGWRPQR